MLTTQEKIQEIKKACIAANPAILDLVFGCEVTSDKGEKVTIINKGRDIDGSWFSFLDKENLITTDEVVGGVNEILGRPIHLADILLAVKAYKIKLDFDTRSQPFLFITDWKERTVIWNLLKDDLNLQDTAMIDFLYHLLSKGE